MKILASQNKKSPFSNAFTLVEVLISVLLLSIMVTSLYAGIARGFAVIESARQNLRATELIIERFEAIRLISWDQLNAGYINTDPFVELYDIKNTKSMTYKGAILIEPGPAGLSYADDMRRVTVSLSWVSSGRTNSTRMTSYIARYGLQNYVY
jgi:prepilin-type N-terminal cleavage/methylation domain-containing protein